MNEGLLYLKAEWKLPASPPAPLGQVPRLSGLHVLPASPTGPELPNLPVTAQWWGDSGSQAYETLMLEALLAPGQGLASGCKGHPHYSRVPTDVSIACAP